MSYSELNPVRQLSNISTARISAVPRSTLQWDKLTKNRLKKCNSHNNISMKLLDTIITKPFPSCPGIQHHQYHERMKALLEQLYQNHIADCNPWMSLPTKVDKWYNFFFEDRHQFRGKKEKQYRKIEI